MPPRSLHPAQVFAVIFVTIFVLHAPLLQLPYFWDEAGYYVPAARDILFGGSLIPHSTVSNAHPPLVLAWVALWWKIAGYAPLVARSAMLVVAAFSLLGLFRLAERVANTEVAIASTVCAALYPVFFAQSSLVQVDLAAAGLTFWGLTAYLDDRPVAVACWFTLAALAKETAILAPVALVAWEIVNPLVLRKFVPLGEAVELYSTGPIRLATLAQGRLTGAAVPTLRRIIPLVVPILPLGLWYTYHYIHTGYVFGNPEFFRYNVAATLNPLRFLLAFVLRLWQAFGYLHLWLLTLGMLLALLLQPVKELNVKVKPPTSPNVGEKWGTHGDKGTVSGGPAERNSATVERERIAIPVQIVFFVVILTYVITMALIGGAELARYMLSAVPLVIILAVSTLRRRLRYWTIAVAVVALAFIAAWFWNPPYGFSPEDNLAYRDYIMLHEDAERFLEARYPMAHVLTAWPASDELTRPWLGYVTRPMQVVRVEDFSLEEMLSAADFRQNLEVALVFSTKYEPDHPLLDRWNPQLGKRWTNLKRRFFGFHRDLPPAAVAQILGGRVVYSEERKGEWVGVIEMKQDQILDARNANEQ
jgi:Dolichyl-phosphate-mannose-protein mannosyltransferase